MSSEPEQACLNKVEELLFACPAHTRRLLEKCYITIYEEEYPLPSFIWNSSHS